MDVKEALLQYQQAVQARDLATEEATKHVQTALRMVKEQARKSSVEVEGQLYQIRERGGHLYLCICSNKPGRRPRNRTAHSS